MNILVITGTGTGVGKTMVTAACAALAVDNGQRVAVVKPAQTGVGPHEPGDLDEVARFAGKITTRELRRYPEPLAPDTAAARAGLPQVHPGEIASVVAELAAEHDLVLVEGAGGLLVRFDPAGGTLADAAELLKAPVLVVASAGLGTLNTTELTARELRSRRLDLAGIVIGSWPGSPDLASRCNVADLPEVAAAPLLGALPAGAASLAPADFRTDAPSWLAARLDGTWDAEAFRGREAP